MYEVQLSKKHKLIGVPAIDTVRNLFSDVPTMEHNGALHCLIPHDETNVFMLRKMGFDIPAPILFHYDWASSAFVPFDVQRKTCAMLTMANRAYVLNDMGTGKTKCILWAWHYLRSQKRCGRLLVVAPLSTLNFTWAREIFATLGSDIKYSILHGSKKKRFQLLSDPETEIFIINHDGVKLIKDEIKKYPDIDVVAIDELAVFRNAGSDRTKAMRDVARPMQWAWGMTGSPMPTAPTDVYGQAMIITPDRIPKAFRQFEHDLMYKVSQFTWKPKEDAIERAFNVMQPAVRFTLDDVVELPDIIERNVDVDMGAVQLKTYKDLVLHAQALVQGGMEINAANAGAVMMKLLQVSMGWVYTKDANGNDATAVLDNQNRLDALLDGVTSTSNKCLVFVPFKHALQGVSDFFNDPKVKVEHAVVSGDTPANHRADLFNAFQNTSKYRVLLAHPQCLAHGITLTAADTVIWFAPITSLEIYEQANRRIRRVGQKHKQQIIHLQSTPVEKKIYRILRDHQQVQNKFLDLFEELGGDQW